MAEKFAVILVDSTSHAMRIEKLLMQNNLLSKMIPVPRHLSSDCGVCVRILQDDMEIVRGLIEAQRIVIRSIEVI